MHKAVRTVMNTSVILLYCYTEDVIKYLFCGAFSLLFSSKTKTEQKHTHCTVPNIWFVAIALSVNLFSDRYEFF